VAIKPPSGKVEKKPQVFFHKVYRRKEEEEEKEEEREQF
jgi:hypothetical protein